MRLKPERQAVQIIWRYPVRPRSFFINKSTYSFLSTLL